MAYETDVYISLHQLGLVHLKRGVPWTTVAPREARRASPPPPCSHEVEIVIPPSHVVSVPQILVRQYLAKWGCTTRCRVGVALAGHADQHLVQHLVQHLACVCPACGLLSGRIEGWMRFSHLQFVHYTACAPQSPSACLAVMHHTTSPGSVLEVNPGSLYPFRMHPCETCNVNRATLIVLLVVLSNHADGLTNR
jgi:hypothetical protein